MKKSNTAIAAIAAIAGVAGAAIGAVATATYFKKKILPVSINLGVALEDVLNSLFKSDAKSAEDKEGGKEAPASEEEEETTAEVKKPEYAPSMRLKEVSSYVDAVFYE